MHPEWATYLRALLTLHISCGRRSVCVRSCSLGNGKRRQSASALWQDLFLGYGSRCGYGSDFVIRTAGLLPRHGCGFSFSSAFAAYRVFYLKAMYKGARPRAVGWLAAVVTVLSSLLLFLMDFSATEVDASGRGPDSGTHGEHCFHCVRDHRNAHGAGFDPWIYQAIGRKDVLVVWAYAGDDRQLLRGNDRLFRSESDALVWCGLVVWLWPTIVGASAIAVWTAYYKKRFLPKPKIALA